MAPLRKLFGKEIDVEKLPALLKPLLEQMRQERVAYEALLARAEGSVKRAEQLGQAVTPLEQQVAQLQQRLAAFDGTAAAIAEIKQDAAALEADQTGAKTRLDEVRARADAAHAALEAMRGSLAEIMAAKAELPGVIELVKPLGALRSEIGAVETKMSEVTGRLDQVRSDQDKIAAGGAAAASRLASVEQELQNAVTRVEAFAGRAQTLETAVTQLQQLMKDVPDVKRDLSTLNALAEFVSQKVSALEGQRDVVERTTQRAERLTELTGQVDRQLHEQHENMKFLTRLETDVEEIKKKYQVALESGEEIEKKHAAIEEEERRLAEEFAALREALGKSASQFTFERDGLDSLSQRVTQLREAVGEVEQRLPAVDQARSSIDAVAAEAKRVTGVMQEMGKQIRDLESQAAKAQAAETQLREVQGAVAELTGRLEALGPARLTHELDERARQLEDARSRIARLEAKLSDWDTLEGRIDQALTIAQERATAVEAVRADLRRVFEVADQTVAQVREVAALNQEIGQRREALDPVLVQLRELDQAAASLAEHKKQFAEAEERLARLDALLIDLKTTFQTVLDQKDFLERVVETAGSLALQTMQAEAAISTLREASEGAKGQRRPGAG